MRNIKYNNIILMLIGLPASGKSTFARQVQDSLDNVFVFSSDDVRQEVYEDETCQDNPKLIFDILYKKISKELKNKHDNNEGKKIIIVDACSTKKKDRQEIFKRFNKKAMIYGILMNTDTYDCLKRNNERDRVVPAYAILRMYKNFENPKLDEGFEEILEVNDDSINEVIKKIKTISNFF